MTSALVPTDLYFYRPDRSTYALSWRINPQFELDASSVDDITGYDCEVQTDSSPNFDTINLKTYDKNNVLSYQDGYFFKAFVFNNIPLLSDITLYYRVRVKSDTYESNWSTYSSFVLKKVSWYEDLTIGKDLLPDSNIYNRDGVTLANKVEEMYIRELQDLKNELVRIEENVNFYKVQDEDLFDMFGVLLEYVRDNNRPYVEYRRQLMEIWNSYLLAGTEGAMNKLVKALFGTTPVIGYFKTRYGWMVYDTQDLPLENTEGYSDPTAHMYLPSDGMCYTTGTWIGTCFSDYFGNVIPSPNSSCSKGLTWVLNIYNAFEIDIDKDFFETIVNKLKPLHTKVYFKYYYPQVASDDFGGKSDWGGDGDWGSGTVGAWESYIPS